MSITKKLLAGSVLFYLISGACANANELNIDLNLGQPAPVYVAPPPPPPPPPIVYAPSPAYVVAPYNDHYDPHHRRHDWRYWHDHGYHDHDHWDHDHWDHDHR